VHLELGGKNAIIVMTTPTSTSQSRESSGRRSARRPAVHGSITRDRSRIGLGELQSKLVAAAERLRLGPVGGRHRRRPLINRAALEKVHSYTEIGKQEGAKLLTGGEQVANGGGFYYRRPCLPTPSRDEDRPGGDLRRRRIDSGRELRRGGRRRELRAYGLSSSI